MPLFRFRQLQPRQTRWVNREGISVEDAIQSDHYQYTDGVSLLVDYRDGKEKQVFALYETEAGEQLVSRICTCGMRRAGGIRSPLAIRTLADVARALGVDLSVLDGEWSGEEQY